MESERRSEGLPKEARNLLSSLASGYGLEAVKKTFEHLQDTSGSEPNYNYVEQLSKEQSKDFADKVQHRLESDIKSLIEVHGSDVVNQILDNLDQENSESK